MNGITYSVFIAIGELNYSVHQSIPAHLSFKDAVPSNLATSAYVLMRTLRHPDTRKFSSFINRNETQMPQRGIHLFYLATSAVTRSVFVPIAGRTVVNAITVAKTVSRNIRIFYPLGYENLFRFLLLIVERAGIEREALAVVEWVGTVGMVAALAPPEALLDDGLGLAAEIRLVGLDPRWAHVGRLRAYEETAQSCLNSLMTSGAHSSPKTDRKSYLRECHVIHGIVAIHT